MKIRFVFFFFYSFIIGTAIVVYHIKQIPSGNELGGLAQFYLTMAFGILIIAVTFAASVVDYLIHKNSRYFTVLQFSIHTLGLVLLYYMSWRICVYSEPLLTRYELKEMQRVELPSLRAKSIKLMEHGRIFRPDEETEINDIERIEITIKGFLNRYIDNTTQETEYWKLYENLFEGFNVQGMDPVKSKAHRDAIANSISVRLILYSPDFNKLLVILTFDRIDMELNSNALVLLGSRTQGGLEFFKYRCVQNFYGELSQNYSYYSAVLMLVDKDSPCYKSSPFALKFWTSGYFEKVEVEGKEKYLFQVNELLGFTGKEKKYDNIPVPSLKIILYDNEQQH